MAVPSGTAIRRKVFDRLSIAGLERVFRELGGDLTTLTLRDTGPSEPESR